MGLAVLGSGCQKPSTDTAGNSATAAPPDPMVITIDEATSRRFTIAPVTTRNMTETIRLAGRLHLNDYQTARIGAPIPGRVVDISVAVGEQVRQGQILAELSSPELAQAQLDFLRANSQQRLLSSAVERARTLLDADVIGSVELQRRQSEFQVASAEKNAAADRLRSLGLSTQQLLTLEKTGAIQSRTSIIASLTGTVIERNVTRGQAVGLSDTVFVVSDLNHLWGLAEAPEQEARFVRTGQQVSIEIPALGGKPVQGIVAFVADVVNPATRTVRIGVDLDNRDRRLKPLMLMTMLVEGASATNQVVPTGAVVREGDKDFVMVETGTNVFRLTPVELGFEHDGLRTLTNPLPEASRIVVEGAFHLNNLRLQQSLTRR